MEVLQWDFPLMITVAIIFAEILTAVAAVSVPYFTAISTISRTVYVSAGLERCMCVILIALRGKLALTSRKLDAL
jgi:hypothetical protein